MLWFLQVCIRVLASTATIPTNGVEGFKPGEFEASGLKATVTGDTLVIAAQSRASGAKPKGRVSYDLGQLGQGNVQFSGDLAGTHSKGMDVKGSTLSSDTLTFGGSTDKTKLRNASIDLADGRADNLVFSGNVNAKKTVVTIDSKDQIINKKGEVFTAEDVNKNGKIKGAGLGGVRFDVV